MLLMPTVSIMKADSKDINIRSSYNLGAISFTPNDVVKTIKKHIPEFKIDYNPDFRQDIADGWPASIDDSIARKDWNWAHKYDLESITKEMLTELKKKYD